MADIFLLDYPTYEDYLNSFVRQEDMRYLRSEHFSRYLVSLGYRSTVDIYTKDVFEKRKAAVIAVLKAKAKKEITFSLDIKITDPVLLELAKREMANIHGTLSTIIFINHRRKNGFEVSGYIDFEETLRHASIGARDARNWLKIFSGTVKLRPRPSDLSYVDWHSHNCIYFNNSDNYIVNNDVNGLKFMFRGDHKMISVDADEKARRNKIKRSMHFSKLYGYVVLYDYNIRLND